MISRVDAPNWHCTIRSAARKPVPCKRAHTRTPLVGYDVFTQPRPAGAPSPAAMPSNLRLLRHLKGIVDLDSEIANRAFQLRVSEQQLHRPKVLCPPVDQRSFCASLRAKRLASVYETLADPIRPPAKPFNDVYRCRRCSLRKAPIGFPLAQFLTIPSRKRSFWFDATNAAIFSWVTPTIDSNWN